MKNVARRILLLLFASGLLGGGAYVLFMCLERPNIYGMLRGGGIAAILIALGGYLVWDDFVRPHIRPSDR